MDTDERAVIIFHSGLFCIYYMSYMSHEISINNADSYSPGA